MFRYLLYIFLTILFSSFRLSAQIELRNAFPNLSFNRPVDLQHPGDGSNRLFVVEQQGTIQVFPNDSLIQQKSIFLDIRDRVSTTGNEEGLLGLAFHPNFASNDYFYVYYSAANPRRSILSRFNASGPNSNSADPISEVIILEVLQPENNHNGGQISFGPDQMLYVGLGDGGGAGDQHGEIGNAQDLSNLLGSILRINVDQLEGNRNYSIPQDNPFYGNVEGIREEIYAYGLRNPWRFSFDLANGDLWAADVGQNRYEEIDLILPGRNYGWRITEGKHCFNPPNNCDMDGISLPIWEYNHTEGQSITGGFVYRGAAIPELNGYYIYADYVQGKLWALHYQPPGAPDNFLLFDSELFISSFGQDEEQELYICSFDGKIYRFKEGSYTGFEDLLPRNVILLQNYPNPFTHYTEIPFNLSETAKIQLDIYDSTGNLVVRLFPGIFPPGEHRVTWYPKDVNGQDLPDGNYLYQMKANGDIVGSKYMTVIN